jgi:putative ABC transport system permease protein
LAEDAVAFSSIKVAARSLLRHKVFSAVNILGLAIGIACCILLSLYILYELSYDRFHANADNLYRVTTGIAGRAKSYLRNDALCLTPKVLAASLREEFPEVVQAGRLDENSVLIRYGEKAFDEKRFFFIEPEFMELFSFRMLQGDAATLKEPYTVLVSQSTARKLFGDEDPIGKVLRYGSIFDLTVTGVVEDAPANSHLHFDYFASAATANDYWKEGGGGDVQLMFAGPSRRSTAWMALSTHTYVQLRPDCDARVLEQKLNDWVKQFYDEGHAFHYCLEPLTSIHLLGHGAMELEENGDIRYIYLLSAVTLLILLIACANYMILSTARSSTRAREVGVRKVLGAQRTGLMRQFIGESTIMALLALMLALAMASLALPYFSNFVNRPLTLDLWDNKYLLVILAGITCMVGVIAGIYPAVFLSSFKPIQVLKGQLTAGSRGSEWFRGVMVIGQYVISITLIVCTIVVYQQLRFIYNSDLGFNAANVLAIEVGPYPPKGSFAQFKKDLLAHPGILEVAGSDCLPTSEGGGANGVYWEGKQEGDDVSCNWTNCDYDFLNLYDIELVEGRNFSPEYRTDKKRSVLLNQAAVRAFGWNSAVGKAFGIRSPQEYTVIGVVNDYHSESLHREIEPRAIMLDDGIPWILSVKLAPDDIPGTVEFIGKLWPRYFITPFECSFVEDEIDAWYSSERRLATIFTAASAMTIFVACLGLFGLACYSAERRTREIGTRKVLGASVPQVVMLLSRQFAVWVLIANIMAWPLAYYMANRWLQGFAYRIDLTIAPFAVAGAVALAVAVLTVTGQAFKAARANPIDALRYE